MLVEPFVYTFLNNFHVENYRSNRIIIPEVKLSQVKYGT